MPIHLHRRVAAATLCTISLILTSTPAVAGDAERIESEPVLGSVVVRAAGDRDRATGLPVPLAGALVRAYTDVARTASAGECTTDESGTCTIAGLLAGTYFVAPAGDPPGDIFRRLGTVTTSFGAHEPYMEAVEIGEGVPTTRSFAFARANPPLPSRCGVRLTLMYDLSGSIADDEAAAMRAASLEFVDALTHTPSAIAIASFATTAPAAGNTNLAPTAVDTPSGVAVVKAAVGALVRPAGDDRYTNWDAAFRSVTGQSDLVVLFTDGNPTVHGVPAVHPPVQTGLDQIDAGVMSANAVKSAGARVLAVGVGDVDELSAENLAVVSGPTEGVDYAITSFARVHTVLRDLADDLCPPVSVPVSTPVSELVRVELVPRFTG